MIVAGIICGTVLVLWLRAEPFVHRLIQLKEGGRDAAVSPTTNRTIAPRATPAAPAGPVVIPDDLEALALRESEVWAQDDLRDVMKEKYKQLGGDWQKVRRAMGVGEMP